MVVTRLTLDRRWGGLSSKPAAVPNGNEYIGLVRYLTILGAVLLQPNHNGIMVLVL